MAIKIYQSQIRPTEEVTARASTPGMRVSMDTAASVGKAFKGMASSGEALYVKYEQQKSENEVIEASKKMDENQVADTGEFLKEGLGTKVNKFKESTKPDEALANYKQEWQTQLDTITPTLKGKFAKRYFQSYMNKRYISESGAIRNNTFVNFRNESRSLKINKLQDITYRLSNNPEGSVAHNQASADKNDFFSSQNNYDLFGDKFKQLEFDTLNNIDALTIEVDLDKNPRQTYENFKAGKYKNLNADSKTKLGLKITLAAQQQTANDLKEERERSVLGLPEKYSAKEYLAPFVGYKDYEQIKNIVDTNNYVREAITDVHIAKSGDLKDINLYDLTGDNIASKRKANNIITNEIAKRQKAITEGDAAGYFSKVDPELKAIDDSINKAQNVEDKKKFIEEKKTYLDQKYDDLDITESKRFYLSKAESSGYVTAIKNAERWQDQEGILQGITELYGKDNMPKIINHLVSDGLPMEHQQSLATNSVPLKKDLLAAAKIPDLESLVKKEISSAEYTGIDRKIAKKLQKYEDIIMNQPEGNTDPVGFMVDMKASIRKAVLLRVVNGTSTSTAIKNVTEEFLADYSTKEKTFWVPKDVNGEGVSQDIVYNKAELLKLHIENTDYLERFHGEDGFAHYATTDGSLSTLPDFVAVSTPKVFNTYVKDTMIKSIKKNSKWLLNDKGTGLILYFEGTKGDLPIINKNGDKIEFLFVDDPSQIGKQKIYSTEYLEPLTGLPLEVVSPMEFSETEMTID